MKVSANLWQSKLLIWKAKKLVIRAIVRIFFGHYFPMLLCDGYEGKLTTISFFSSHSSLDKYL